VFRGVNADVTKEYTKKKESNTDVTWWGFSSCTTQLNEVKDFISCAAQRTVFFIHIYEGYKISEFSDFRHEEEVLLLPATTFTVNGVLEQDGFSVVHLQQKEPKNPLLDI